MTKLAYLDCQTGIAGDMCLGALVSAGVPLEYLIAKLQGLGLEQEYRLRAQSVYCNGQLATKIHVDLLHELQQHHHSHEEHHDSSRNLPEINGLITAANLPPRVLEWSLAVFRKLAEAEGAVHGIAPEKVHFHEVGAIDAIVDIVGTCLGLDWLGIDRLYCSALPTGSGRVKAAHGWLPVPAPAVLKLWESRQVPIYSNGIERELVTPTGAALAVTLATSFGSPPAMIIQKVGNGAGSSQLPIPNMLRLWIGEVGIGNWELGIGNWELGTNEGEKISSSVVSAAHDEGSNLETIVVLQTQIDDLSPQGIGYLYERLFKVGAVDVFTQAIGMKKSRPGILLTVICHPQDISACEGVLFSETTTLGIRRLIQQRRILPRAIQQVQTEYGEIRVKVAWSEEAGEKRSTNVQPEYEDCASIARQHHLSWRAVHQLVLDTWRRQQGSRGGSGVAQ
ncbi:MAG: nickel pincer cofactor biosynthesis protein LarC [Symploca sp. SIO2E6]|nr:nickel pincer cofactor biosynthesis protein LarC [Symploca sp. SIO2E6]